jgi:hypothetical protein
MPYLKTSITICFFTILSFSTLAKQNTTKKIKVNQDRIERILNYQNLVKI